MARRKRQFSTFNLSFLDIMSCGFGAVVLIFLIIKHESDVKVETKNQDVLAEINLLEEDVTDGRENLVRARNTVSALDQQLADAQGIARQISIDIDAIRDRIREISREGDDQQIDLLADKLKELETQKKALEDDQNRESNRRFLGEGDRQYLTGLKLGGGRILILIDASTSMLDDTLVNIIRRRNMSNTVKRNSPKWLQAQKIVQWLTAQVPRESNYQIYTFNTAYKSVIPGTENTWLDIRDLAELDQAILNLQETVPDGGTSLVNVFSAIQGFEQLPDNIYLITDGLPTQGDTPPKNGAVTGKQRERLFDKAIERIPFGIPINIILLPMEGDPLAAASYWRLAQWSRGSFLSPSKDWP